MNGSVLLLSELSKEFKPIIIEIESSVVRIIGDAIKVKHMQIIESPLDVKASEDSVLCP